MQINLKKIPGSWSHGYALDKHTLSSTYIGDDTNGNPQFDTTRSDYGEALYQLKYKHDWTRVDPIAQALYTHIYPLLPTVGLIVPMPASKARPKQPVTEISMAVGRLANIPVFTDILIKAPRQPSAGQLKNLQTRDEKVAALEGRFILNPAISNKGSGNALIIDDLFDTGASMETAYSLLKTYSKINKIFVATVTWK